MSELSAIGRISVSSGAQKPGWFYLSIDDDFSRYYGWFCRNRGSWDLPMNGCHMTFIAGEKEERLISLDEIARYLDEDVEFFYEPRIMTEGRSFWIDARCPRLDQIRKELALPCKWRGYHVTLGNLKNRQPRR